MKDRTLKEGEDSSVLCGRTRCRHSHNTVDTRLMLSSVWFCEFLWHFFFFPLCFIPYVLRFECFGSIFLVGEHLAFQGYRRYAVDTSSLSVLKSIETAFSCFQLL